MMLSPILSFGMESVNWEIFLNYFNVSFLECCVIETNFECRALYVNLFYVILVYIWDDVLKELVMELSFGCPVMSVKMRRDK